LVAGRNQLLDAGGYRRAGERLHVGHRYAGLLVQMIDELFEEAQPCVNVAVRHSYSLSPNKTNTQTIDCVGPTSRQTPECSCTPCISANDRRQSSVPAPYWTRSAATTPE